MQSPQGANPRPAMRAPQESLTPSDFVYGHVLGLGSYSKASRPHFLSLLCFEALARIAKRAYFMPFFPGCVNTHELVLYLH